MFFNFSTVLFYGQVMESVTASFQLLVKREEVVWSLQLEQQTFTGSDFGDTPAHELARFR